MGRGRGVGRGRGRGGGGWSCGGATLQEINKIIEAADISSSTFSSPTSAIGLTMEWFVRFRLYAECVRAIARPFSLRTFSFVSMYA